MIGARAKASQWVDRFTPLPRTAPPAAEGRLDRHDLMAHGAWIGAAILIAAAVALTPAPVAGAAGKAETLRLFRLTHGDLTDKGLAPLIALDPAAAAIALRVSPLPPTPLFGTSTNAASRAVESLTLANLPGLSADQARLINAAIPLGGGVNTPAKPFIMPSGELLDQTRAIDCLTAAVYYESNGEPLEGQQAVAQVILNRMRHPAFPKSVCGVVFEGSNRGTGCQFTFTCDGSLNRTPSAAGWARSRQVAEAALSGFVMKSVGDATHYHAEYVVPYWATTLVKIGKVGTQIFYRWTGGWGAPGSFNGRYAGVEPTVALATTSTGQVALNAAMASANALMTASGPALGAVPGVPPTTAPAAAPAPAEVHAAAAPTQAAPAVQKASAPVTAAPPAPAHPKAAEPSEAIAAGPTWERR